SIIHPNPRPWEHSSMIAFNCPECDTELEVPDNKAGTKVACSECGRKLSAPAPATKKADTRLQSGSKSPPSKKADTRIQSGTKTAAAKKPARRFEEDDEDDEEEEERRSSSSKKKPKKGNTALILGVGGGVIVLLAGVAAAIWAFTGKENKESNSSTFTPA